jgi:signal transduction histidine kinase
MFFAAAMGPLQGLAQSNSPGVGTGEEIVATSLQFGEEQAKARSYAEIGLPFSLKHFAAQDYEQHYQNWEVVQDERGVTYVANHDGVLEYDGQSWRLTPTLTNTTVRSLALSDSTVFVGAQGDFGYLKSDSMGATRYVSLIDEVPERKRDFKDVWGTHVTTEGVYFQAKKCLFRWDGRRIRSWESEGGFHMSFSMRNQLYVRDTNRGLLKMVGDSLEQVPGGKQFAENAVYVMVPYDAEKILVGTSKEGFFLYDGQTFTPFPTEADAFLQEHQLYGGEALPGGRFALSTLGGGVVVIDREGRIVQMLSQETGLPGNYVTSVHPGRQGGLWMTFGNSGLVRADLRPQLSRFDERLGLEGVIYYMQRYEGTLYVATGTGVYRLERNKLAPMQRQRASFERVPGVFQAWNLSATPHGLMAASERGVYLIEGKEARKVIETPVYSLANSYHFDDRIYAGTKEGLMLLEKQRSGWGLQAIKNVDQEVRSFVEKDDGTIWASNEHEHVLRVRFSDERDRSPKVARFDTSDGLPHGEVSVALVENDLFFYTSKSGLYRAREASDGRTTFAPDTTLQPAGRTDTTSALLALAGDANHNVWMIYRNRVEIAARQPGGGYNHVTPPSLRFSRGTTQAYIENGMTAWISDGDELLRYQPRGGEVSQPAGFPVLIRRVKVVGDGEVVYGGNESAAAPSGGEQATTELPYAHNSLQFSFTAPNYRETVQNEYQYRLKGEDDSWSDWTVRPRKTYASLGPGRYRFEVRTRNDRAATVSTAGYAFRILPPWYRTWAAYATYLAALVLLGVGYWRSGMLVGASRRAEERARELKRERKLSKRLQEANTRLEEANQLKEELLANTSHELRTPLTSIRGFAEVLKEELPEEHHEFLGYIESNTNRLIQTVDSLMSLAKLRAGVVEADQERVELGEQAEEVVTLLRPLAEEKDINLRLDKDSGVCVSGDPQHVHQILNNLVGNAIKFTEEGGVAVSVEHAGEEAVLKVRDSGVGISEEFMPHLFEDFEQESSGLTRSHEGSGLGLSITSRLVNLMDGAINVESAKGEGSVFTVTFPVDEVTEKAEVSAS